ncbi:hypothetical protein BDR26DRAFT_803813 [Obelidium mucronatum]|nr:hypothetical protein BDR26DRAFT_803813 [Obelidium mucronatum]
MPNGAGKGCFYAPNLVLGAALDKYRTLTCDPGFYCPYLNATDSTTVPVLCPPSPMCVKYRLAGFPCLAQGIYEPIICRPGYYCPNYKTMLPCPQGYFCPTGTVKPFKCTIFSSCPQGSIYQVVYLFLIILAGVDGVLLLLFWGIRVKHQRMQAMASNTSRHHRYPTEGGIWHSLIGRISSLKNSWGRLMTSLFGIASTSRLRMLSQTMMHPSSSRALHEYRRDSGTASTLLMEEDFPIPEEEISRETLRHDLTVLSKAFRDTFPLHGQVRMNFRFEGLELTLKNGHKVLSGVTGKIEEGKMTAILGPSGAGKTTFMNVLMGKVDKTGGTLFINGQESEVHLYRKIIGYVPQEDIMLQELTVRENVLHSARVRLPRSWNEKKIQSHVDNVLLTLKLSHVAHSVIGDETTRGISGGQRKRVNIAMELAAAPLTIFLDEPTSGLDSTSALDATDILSSMSSLGITIIAVIHQPRIEIFEKFHNVIMVAPGGRVAYMGPVTKIKSYFRALGFEFQESANVSDAVMDILAGKGVNPACAGGKLGVDQVVELWEDRELRKTQRAWKQNREFHSIAPIVVESRGAGFWKQLYHCHQRSVIQQFRKMNAFVLETVVAVIAGVLMGLSTQGKLKELYSGPYASIYAGMSPKPNDVISLFCFLLGLSVALASAPAAVKVFGEEKSVYWREAASGHSRAAYFLGKTISTLFRIAIMALHFTAVFMLLAKPVISPATQYLIVLLQYWGVYGMSCLISMVVRRENASLLAVVMCLFASVFCGYGPSITQAKRWGINWIMELSFNKWAAEAMYASSIRIYENKYNIQNTADMFGWNLYQIERDFIMCFVLGLGMRVIGFILLVVMNRDKQR